MNLGDANQNRSSSAHPAKAHPAAIPIDKLLQDCEFERTKRGGPGGQHRNKTESAIVVTHVPTGVIGQASERRSQHQNRDAAIERLRLNLALAIRVERESVESSSASELWISRVRGGKIQVSQQHKDFPAVLAEALDWLLVFELEIPATAQKLGVSNSQLVKFLKSFPPAWQLVQRERESRNLHRLK